MEGFVIGVLSFLAGLAVGIIGYYFTTILAYEREIDAIFARMCRRYKNTISQKESENKRILEAYKQLQEKQIKKENGKIKRTMNKCYMCGNLFTKWIYRKDSSPMGDDEMVCPICGAVECGGTEVEVELTGDGNIIQIKEGM